MRSVVDRYKQTVVTHRGQETFNVPLMGYCNSPAYVQRQTDKLLREFKEFAKGYVDDIVIFSKTLQEHLPNALATSLYTLSTCRHRSQALQVIHGVPQCAVIGPTCGFFRPLDASAYTTTLVGMSEDFKRRIVRDYQVDPSWKKVLGVLYSNDRNEDAASLSSILGEEIDIMEAQEVSEIPTSPQATEQRAIAVRVPLRKPSANALRPHSPLRPHGAVTDSTEQRAIAVRVPPSH